MQPILNQPDALMILNSKFNLKKSITTKFHEMAGIFAFIGMF